MSTAPMVASATAAPRPATPVANGAANQPPFEPAATNGQSAPSHDNRPAPAPPAAVPGKKGKQKKTPEPNEASKLIAQRITQLELDAAGEKDQEAEIGVCLPPSSPIWPEQTDLLRYFRGEGWSPSIAGTLMRLLYLVLRLSIAHEMLR